MISAKEAWGVLGKAANFAAGRCAAVPSPLGFTLIETLLAVSIFTTVAATVYLSFATGVKARKRLEDTSEGLQRARFALEMMAEDLRNPGRIEAGLLEGSRQSLRISPEGNPVDGFEAGTVEYLLLREGPRKPSLTRRTLRGETVVRELCLVSDVEAFEITYCMLDLRGLRLWVSGWEGADGLPYAVKVMLRAPAASGTHSEYRRLIPLPPSWLRPPPQVARVEAEEGL